MPLIKGSIIIKLLNKINKEENFTIIFIMSYTVFDNSDVKESIFAKGADFIVTKPIQYKTFVDIIEGVISKRK